MDSNNKKIPNMIIPIIMIIVSLFLIFGGLISYLIKEKPAEKNISNNIDNTKINNLKDNEMIYDGYIYTLPDEWLRNEDFSDQLNTFYNSFRNGVSIDKGAVVIVKNLSSEDYKINDVFKDINYFKELLESSDYASGLGEGKLLNLESNTVVVFPYDNNESMKFLMAYMPAYDDSYYMIQLFASKKIDENEEMYLDYDDLNIIVKMLNSRTKTNNYE